MFALGAFGTCLVAGCATSTTLPGASNKAGVRVARSSDQKYVSPATLFASIDANSVSVSRVEPDGRKLMVSHGMRIIQHRDGSLERATELLPSKETVQITALPARLGGGYLFYLTSSSTTMVWSAREFTGKLNPLANLDFGIDGIVPGFDRLYLLRARSKVPVAIDAASGEALDLGPLPPSPDYDTLAFADGWMGAVHVPLRGVLATFDAGATWHSVPDASRVVDTRFGPVLRTSAGWGVLTPDGVLRRWESSGDEGQKLDEVLAALGNSNVDASIPVEAAQRMPRRPLGRDPLRLAVLHGVMGARETAYVAHLGALARVSLENGKLLEVMEQAFPANASCHGIRLGEGFGFVCSEERGPTTVYALEKPLSLKKVLAFAEPRYVADNENGDLVIRGRCESQDTVGGYYCLRTKQGLREIRVRGDIGAERVALFKDGTAVVLVPPRKGAAATLTRVDLEGKATQLKLKLPTSGPVANLIREGIWLNGFTESGKGELLGWVAGTGPFVGIRIRRDGRVEHGEIQNDVQRVLISGRFALLVAQYGQALESVDGGFAWTEVPTLEAPEKRIVTSTREQGCSPIGCATREWLRIGWSKGREESKDEAVEPPERTHIPSPGGGRWTMNCYATGEASPRALVPAPVVDERERARRALSSASILGATSPVVTTLESTAWLPLLEMPAPRLPPGYLGFDAGVEYGQDRLQAYVWGQRGADWGRTGVFAIRVLDRFSVKNGVWSSEVTRSPWADELSAAAAFGQSIGGNTANWQYESEASGREGLLLVRQPAQTDLFIVSEGRAVTPIRGAGALVRTAGVAKLGSSWHFGAPTADGFAVYRIVGDQLSLLNVYPFDEDRSSLRVPPRLIRNTDADAIAILLDATSQYIYPINLLDGSLQTPLGVTPAELAKLPPRCGGNENGFVFTDTVKVAPFVELMGGAAAVNATRIEARFITTETGVCVDVLGALASAVLPESLQRGTPSTPAAAPGVPIPMVLSEQGAASRRWGFACYP